MPRDRGQVLFEKRERVLRRQVEPAPLARAASSLDRSKTVFSRSARSLLIHAAATLSSSALLRRAGIALDRPVPSRCAFSPCFPHRSHVIRDSATASARRRPWPPQSRWRAGGSTRSDPQQTELLLSWPTTRFGSTDSFVDSRSTISNQPSPHAKPSRAKGGEDGRARRRPVGRGG